MQSDVVMLFILSLSWVFILKNCIHIFIARKLSFSVDLIKDFIVGKYLLNE